jgi:histidyl-tRNA synthetase
MTTTNAPGRLLGMRDLFEEDYLALRHAQDALRTVFSSYGYRIVEPPMLEATETFARKAGELAARMYSFQEPGGYNVTLRPEFTSAVIRIFQEQAGQRPLPVRWQYSGSVFRYAPDGSAQPRQFWQLGAELIGAQGPAADAEAAALATRGLTVLGLNRAQVVLSHMGVLRAFLAPHRLSERAEAFLLRSLPALRGGLEQVAATRASAARMGIVRKAVLGGEHRDDLARLARLEQAPNGDARGLASRTPRDIAARLARKLQAEDEAERFGSALDTAHRLAQLHGEPGRVLPALERLAGDNHIDAAPIRALASSLDAFVMQHAGPQTVVVDMALANSIGYYTGLVFEVRSGEHVLGGGGRYDGLLRAMGGVEDVPAIGFALRLYELLNELKGHGPTGAARQPRRVLVVPAAPGAYRASLRVADTLRLAGEAVEQAMVAREFEQHRAYARATGMHAVVTVRENGESERHSVEQ